VANYTDLTDEDLELKLQEVGNQRSEAEAGFKEQMQEIAAEVEARHTARRVAKLAESMTPAELALLQSLKVEDLGGPTDGADVQEITEGDVASLDTVTNEETPTDG
jgi:hypothetical protein